MSKVTFGDAVASGEPQGTEDMADNDSESVADCKKPKEKNGTQLPAHERPLKFYHVAHVLLCTSMVLTLGLFVLTLQLASPFDKRRAVHLEAGSVHPSEERGGWPAINTLLRAMGLPLAFTAMIAGIVSVRRHDKSGLLWSIASLVVLAVALGVAFVLDCKAVDDEIATFGDHKAFIATCALGELLFLAMVFSIDRLWLLRRDLLRWLKLEEDGSLFYHNGRHVSHDRVERVRNAFDDCDHDGGGTIDLNELEYLLAQFGGLDLTPEQIEEKLKQADGDGDGNLNFREFVSMLGWHRACSDTSEYSDDDDELGPSPLIVDPDYGEYSEQEGTTETEDDDDSRANSESILVNKETPRD